MLTLLSRNIENTYRIGQTLGRIIKKPIFLALHGSVGSGKTHFVQGLAKGLDCSLVPRSPTFSIMDEYEGRLPLLHVDVYRLEEEELEPLGLEELLEEWRGVIAMEWSSLFPSLFPSAPLHIQIDILDATHRRISFDSGIHHSLLEELGQLCVF